MVDDLIFVKYVVNGISYHSVDHPFITQYHTCHTNTEYIHSRLFSLFQVNTYFQICVPLLSFDTL